jgi:hypothetical protein
MALVFREIEYERLLFTCIDSVFELHEMCGIRLYRNKIEQLVFILAREAATSR